ncbi:hypothetical protein CFREI_04745 [Corynebacterium freiburgense]|nr:hypothetical protein CFREI_04745 [Corynebacterium freiburgense]
MLIVAATLTACEPSSIPQPNPNTQAGSPEPSTPPRSHAKRTNSPSCSAQQLTAETSDSEGAAGSMFHTVTFTNTADTECSLIGYPGVSLVDAKDNQLGAPADRESGDPGTPVTLLPGGQASFTLRIQNALAYDPKTCSATDTATHLKIYPPEEHASILLPFQATTCTNPDIAILKVSGVRAG